MLTQSREVELQHPPAGTFARSQAETLCGGKPGEKDGGENKDVDFEGNNVLPSRVAALTPEKEKQKSRGEGRRGSDGFARPMS